MGEDACYEGREEQPNVTSFEYPRLGPVQAPRRDMGDAKAREGVERDVHRVVAAKPALSASLGRSDSLRGEMRISPSAERYCRSAVGARGAKRPTRPSTATAGSTAQLSSSAESSQTSSCPGATRNRWPGGRARYGKMAGQRSLR